MQNNTYFSKITDFYHKHKRMPSFREVADICGFKSKYAAVRLVNKLVAQGLLSKDRSGKLLPTPSFTEVRMLGYVEAGFPSPAEEELMDTISLDEYLIHNKEATYVLTVKGDSMMDAGIIEGDMVLVERGLIPKDGDIVIADIDGDWTMKYLRKGKNGKSYLEPANKKYRPLYPTQSLKIGAVVKAVIRKY